MKHKNKHNKPPSALGVDDEKKLKNLMQQAEDEQKKHLSTSDMLKNHKEQDWLNWLDDMLMYDIAYPDTFRRSGDHDGICEVSGFFESHNLSSKEYQKALLTSMCNHINLMSQKQDVSKNLCRLLNAMEGFTNNIFGRKLSEIFFHSKYDSTVWYDHIIKKDVFLKSSILSILANSKLDAVMCANITFKATEYIQLYIKTPYYCTAVLYFFIHQCGKIPDIFFNTFVMILKVTKNNGFEFVEESLLDALESYKFHCNSCFSEGFIKWYEIICIESDSEKFNAKIKKLLV